ncbi:hypothetical protein [Ensifer sp. MJa1]|uniref:hypothetical protein n=1 Tax=Ensifer sp. MJa1 TaxID=2919888 RepID=UPI00300AA2C3
MLEKPEARLSVVGGSRGRGRQTSPNTEPLAKLDRIRIDIVGGLENDMCAMVEEALMAWGLPVYVKAGMLVEAIEGDTTAQEGTIDRTARLIPINLHRMRHLMNTACTFVKTGPKNKEFFVNAPVDIANMILNRVGFWPFPEVTNIVAAQTIEKTGEVINEPGVHRPSRLLLANLPVLPSIVISEEKSDAIEAANFLHGLIDEYEFVGEESKAVAMSMLITPVCRGIIPLAPMHAVTAPTPGSGKSYLSRLASLIATGRPCAVIPPARDEDEFEKRLTAAMMVGPSIISLDNMVGRLGSSLLCQALTEPVIDVRPLGTSNLSRIEQRVTFFANGNNLQVVDDLTRRTLLATVDRNEENPEEHEYKARPDKAVIAERGRYVHAALTIVGSYLKSNGKVRLPPLASYEGWSKSVRESLVWLGYEDPVLSMKAVKANDPERHKREAIFANWPEQAFGIDFKGNPKLLTVAELIEGRDKSLDALSDWNEALKQIAGDGKGGVDKRALGNWLAKQKDKIVGGRKLISRLDSKRKIMNWGCIEVENNSLLQFGPTIGSSDFNDLPF